jgi:hypothetical protein
VAQASEVSDVTVEPAAAKTLALPGGSSDTPSKLAIPAVQAKLLAQWHRGLREMHKAQQQAATRFERRGRWLGVVTVVASTIVSTSLFADASDSLSKVAKIAAGILSLVAAVLAAVQGSLKYGELAAQHRAAVQLYGPLRREVEELRVLVDAGGEVPSERIENLRKRWDEVESESPNVPQDIYDSVARSLNNSRRLGTHGEGGDEGEAKRG